ncbi:trypsin-like serine protease [Streptomyces sp. CJ_13]|uniref:trypsin-like serine protease n=1 Tax=Streptomyces TaxID=1883 RepID=UPI001BDD5524|nr:trypsin-like serine protease [Streptomyces sp. CJ_13]MBT1182658.1 trypsin-like serine protease [Streptomyces sp. CJ_13]
MIRTSRFTMWIAAIGITLAINAAAAPTAEATGQTSKIIKECSERERTTRLKLCSNYSIPGGIQLRIGGPEGPPVNGDCTVAFTVFKRSPLRFYGLTAGHCYKNNRPSVYSQSDYFGQIQEAQYTADRDSALVQHTNDNWNLTILSGSPTTTKQRTIRGTWKPGQAKTVCVGGSFTGEVCDVLIRSSTPRCYKFQVNGQEVERCGLIAGQKIGSRIVQPGDSGGPVYRKAGSGFADAVGIIIGGGSTTNGNDYDMVYYRPIASVLSDMGVELFTCHDEAPEVCS